MKITFPAVNKSSAVLLAALLTSSPFDTKATGLRGALGDINDVTDSLTANVANITVIAANVIVKSDHNCSPDKDDDGNHDNDVDSDSSPVHIGCYKKYFEIPEENIQEATYTLSVGQASNANDAAKICSSDVSKCKNDRFIGVEKVTNSHDKVQFLCHCLTEPSTNPDDTMLSYGDCFSLKDVPSTQKMDLHFHAASLGADCGHDEFRLAMLHRLYAGNEDLSYDIIQNKVRQSPFGKYKSVCGTSEYNVKLHEQAEETNVNIKVTDIKTFEQEQRSKVSSSIKVGASGTSNKPLSQIGGNIWASFDHSRKEASMTAWKHISQNRMFSIEGRIQKGFIEFEEKKHSVTLSDSFMKFLTDYKENGFATVFADDILREFGQFVIKKASFGGSFSRRMVMTQCEYSMDLQEETNALKCFRLAMGGFLNSLKLKTDFEAEVGVCSEDNKVSLQQSFHKSIDTESLQETTGGSFSDEGSFEVTSSSTALLSEDRELMLLSNILEGQMISPITMHHMRWTQKDFDEVKGYLEAHILKRLEAANNAVERCGGKDKPAFFENFNYSDGDLKCEKVLSKCTKVASMGDYDMDDITSKGVDRVSGYYGSADHWAYWKGQWNNSNWRPVVSHVEKIIIFRGQWGAYKIITGMLVTYRRTDGGTHDQTFGQETTDKVEMNFGEAAALCTQDTFMKKIELWSNARIDGMRVTRSDGKKIEIGRTSGGGHKDIEIAKTDGSEKVRSFEAFVDGGGKGYLRNIGVYTTVIEEYDC